MAKTPAAPKPFVVELTPVEHAQVLKAAETGLAVIEALHLVQNPASMELAVRKLRDARPVSAS